MLGAVSIGHYPNRCMQCPDPDPVSTRRTTQPIKTMTSGERVPISVLQRPRHEYSSNEGSVFCIDTHRIDTGIAVSRSRGTLVEFRQLELIDDTDHIYFHFRLRGDTQCLLGEGRRAEPHWMREGSGTLLYHPGGASTLRHIGALDGVTVMIDRGALLTHDEQIAATLGPRLAYGRLCQEAQANAEMHAAATALAQAVTPPQPGTPRPLSRHPLWIGGQAQVLVALFLESLGAVDESLGQAVPSDLALLVRARDLLLSDLANPPTIEALAKASGLSILKLKRGFPKCFGRTIYDMFQQERMLEAQRRLSAGAESVSTVAVDMGYSNLSHFAQAFRRQIGVNPSEVLKRRHRLMSPIPYEKRRSKASEGDMADEDGSTLR